MKKTYLITKRFKLYQIDIGIDYIYHFDIYTLFFSKDIDEFYLED